MPTVNLHKEPAERLYSTRELISMGVTNQREAFVGRMPMREDFSGLFLIAWDCIVSASNFGHTWTAKGDKSTDQKIWKVDRFVKVTITED